jgi:hypothetical protein
VNKSEEQVIKWLGCIAIALTIPATLIANWIYFPLTHELRGMAFSLAGYSPSHPPLVLASYGVMAAFLLAIALLALASKQPLVVAVSGLGLILLVWMAYLRIAVADSDLTLTLALQADWSQTAHLFSVEYTPGNFGIEPTAWATLSFDTLYDRLFSGWYFLGLGAYITFVAGICLIASGLHGVGLRGRRIVWSFLFFVVLATGIVALTGPVLAQRAFGEAVAAEVRNQPVQAIEDYRAAARWDDWYARNARLYARIGSIESAAGFGDTAEINIYAAERLVDAAQSPNAIGNLPEAVALYDHLAATGGPLSALARRRAASIETLYGRHLFADGSFGDSVAAWEGALKRDSGEWLAKFYLTRGYYAVNRDEDAAHLAKYLIKTVSDPGILGVIYSNLGDALTGLNRLDEAHSSYFVSYQLDYVANRRGLDSLVGP